MKGATYMSKDINMAIRLTPNQLKEAIIGAVSANIPVFVWGSPGIGKSSIARQVAEALKFQFFMDFRLSQVDPNDLVMYIPDVNAKAVVQIRPSFIFPQTQHKNMSEEEVRNWKEKIQKDPSDRPASAFLMFDELNSALPYVQATAYQIFLDRRVGEYNLGPFDYIMAAGNLTTDRGVAFNMPTPLANRMLHLELVPDVEEWISNMFDIPDYEIHPLVLAYIKFQQNELFMFDPKVHTRAFPTPRSWEYVSRIIRANWDKATSGKMSNSTLLALIAGAVGEGPARKFLAFANESMVLPPVMDILTGECKNFKFGDRPAIEYSLGVSLCYALTKEMDKYLKESKNNNNNDGLNKLYEYVSNVITFAMNNFTTSEELIISVVQKVFRTMSEKEINIKPDKIAAWPEFRKRYSAIFKKAIAY